MLTKFPFHDNASPAQLAANSNTITFNKAEAVARKSVTGETNSYIQSGIPFPFNDSITVSFWARAAIVGAIFWATKYDYSYFVNDGQQHVLSIRLSNTILKISYGPAYATIDISTGSTLNIKHFVVSISGLNVKVYIDKVLVNDTTLTCTNMFPVSILSITMGASHNWYLGGDGYVHKNFSVYFEGRFRDMAIYDTILTQTEIDTLYAEELNLPEASMLSTLSLPDTSVWAYRPQCTLSVATSITNPHKTILCVIKVTTITIEVHTADLDNWFDKIDLLTVPTEAHTLIGTPTYHRHYGIFTDDNNQINFTNPKSYWATGKSYSISYFMKGVNVSGRQGLINFMGVNGVPSGWSSDSTRAILSTNTSCYFYSNYSDFSNIHHYIWNIIGSGWSGQVELYIDGVRYTAYSYYSFNNEHYLGLFNIGHCSGSGYVKGYRLYNRHLVPGEPEALYLESKLLFEASAELSVSVSIPPPEASIRMGIPPTCTVTVNPIIQARPYYWPKVTLSPSLHCSYKNTVENSGSGNDGLLTGNFELLPSHIKLGQVNTNFQLPTNCDWFLIESYDSDGNMGPHIWSDNINKLEYYFNEIHEAKTTAMIYHADTGLSDIYINKILEWLDIEVILPVGNWVISNVSVINYVEPRLALEMWLDRNTIIGNGYYKTGKAYINGIPNGRIIDRLTNKEASSTLAYIDGTVSKVVVNNITGMDKTKIKFHTNAVVTKFSFSSIAIPVPWGDDGGSYSMISRVCIYRALDLTNFDDGLRLCRGHQRSNIESDYFAPTVFDKVTTANNAFYYYRASHLSTLEFNFPELTGAFEFFTYALCAPKRFYVPKVTTLERAFSYLQTSMISWPEDFGVTNNCTNLFRTFEGQSLHRTIVPEVWDTSRVTDMTGLFEGISLDYLLSVTDISSIYSLDFNSCSYSGSKLTIASANLTSVSFYNFNAPNTDVLLVAQYISSLSSAFKNAKMKSLTIDLYRDLHCYNDYAFSGSNIKTISIARGKLYPTNANYMFEGCYLNYIPDNIDFSNCVGFDRAFAMPYWDKNYLPLNASQINTGPSAFNPHSISVFENLGKNTTAEIIISEPINFNLERSMFANSRIKHIGDVHILDNGSFLSCPILASVGKITFPSGANLQQTFYECGNLVCIKEMDTETVKPGYIDGFFYGCSSLVAPNAQEVLQLYSAEGYHYINPGACP